MNTLYSLFGTYYLPLLFIITSLTGAGQNSSASVSSDTIIIESSPDYQKTDIPWVDPLFQIDGQLCQHVRKIFQDKSGNLWFGTNVYGLMRYDGDTLVYLEDTPGLASGRITGIVEDKEGNLWFGAYGGITKYDGSTFTNFTTEDGLLDDEVWCVTIDRNGIFWIGTTIGVSRFDGNKFTTFPIPKAKVKDTTTAFYYDRVTSIVEDRDGGLWFGTDGFGICKYNGTTFSHLTVENGLCNNSIADMMEDEEGNMWIGTMFGGMSRYDGKSFTNFTKDGIISGIETTALYEDKNKNIWFSSEGYGVYRYDGKSFTNFNKDDGLSSHGILSIFEDNEGRFWLGGWLGLFRYYKDLEKAGEKSFFSVTVEGPW